MDKPPDYLARLDQLYQALSRRREYTATLLAAVLPEVPAMPGAGEADSEARRAARVLALTAHSRYQAAVLHDSITTTMLLLQIRRELLEASGPIH